MLPADAYAEEIGAPEYPQILPGVVEAEIEVTAAVVESSAEGETLEILLVPQRRRGWVQRIEVIRRRIAVTAPDREPEVRVAQVLGHPLSARRKAGAVAVGLVEIGEHGEAVVVAGNQIVRQA